MVQRLHKDSMPMCWLENCHKFPARRIRRTVLLFGRILRMRAAMCCCISPSACCVSASWVCCGREGCNLC